MMLWLGLKVLTISALILVVCPQLFAQSLTWLGTLPGYMRSVAFGIGVKSDGTPVVAGSSYRSGTEALNAFRWTPSGGMQDLGPGAAYGVSPNGTAIVGASGNQAFLWTEESGLQLLGTLGGRTSEAYGTADYGTVVVGISSLLNGQSHAFFWSIGTGMVDMGTLGGTYSMATGVSADGTVIAGVSTTSSGRRRAFRWTEIDGMQDLGVPSGASWSEAVNISPNGAIIVGYCGLNGYSSFRWTEADGMQLIGSLGGGYTKAWHVSDNSIIVGDGGSDRAFRWTPTGGIEDLNVTYASLLTNGSRLKIAYAISADGRYIVGVGYNAATGRDEAFLLDTQTTCITHDGDVDSNGCIDDADLLAVLFAFGCSGGCGREDTNCDGVVDDADLLQVLFNFGSGC